MEANSMKFSILLSALLVSPVFAAVKKPYDDLARYRSEVMQMGARLSTLEKEIGAKTNLYISSLEQIRQFEADIKVYRNELTKKQSEVKRAEAENKRILQNYLLESENETTEPWQRKVHLELLKQAQVNLKARETELQSFQTKVAEFDQKLLDLKNNEEELSVVIKDLEARKKTTMESYLSKIEKKKKFESKVQQVQIQKNSSA